MRSPSGQARSARSGWWSVWSRCVRQLESPAAIARAAYLRSCGVRQLESPACCTQGVSQCGPCRQPASHARRPAGGAPRHSWLLAPRLPPAVHAPPPLHNVRARGRQRSLQHRAATVHRQVNHSWRPPAPMHSCRVSIARLTGLAACVWPAIGCGAVTGAAQSLLLGGQPRGTPS